MKTIRIFFILIFLINISFITTDTSCAVTGGTILYVGGNQPGNYSTIQAAINAATTDDTVYVYPGTYYETILVNKSIHLLGENKTTTIIDGAMKGDVIRVTANQVTISGFTVTNGGRPYLSFFEGGGIRLDPSSHSNISHNIITENTMYGLVIIENTSSHNIISHNIISSNGRPNYRTRSYFNLATIHSPYNTIADNIIENALGVGLVVCYWSYNTTIHGNIIRNNTMGGIRGRHFFNNTINDNIIEHNTLFGIRILNESAQNHIENNTFHKNKPCDAFFTVSSSSLTNYWNNNYWSHPRLLPKVIPGYLRPNKNSIAGIPWFAIDQNPAQEPHKR